MNNDIRYTTERTFIHMKEKNSSCRSRSSSCPPSPSMEDTEAMNNELSQAYAQHVQSNMDFLAPSRDKAAEEKKEEKEQAKPEEEKKEEPAAPAEAKAEAKVEAKPAKDDPRQRVGSQPMAEMRLLTQIWRMDQTRWIRVVHSGYGNAVWHEDLRASNLTFVAASAHPEGCYVHIPPNTAVDDIVNTLTQINLGVRRKTQFADMKRANKSRLQFKNEVLVNASEGPKGDDSGSGSTTASDDSLRGAQGAQGEKRGELAGYLESFLQPTMGKPMPDKQFHLPNRPPAEKKGGRQGLPLDCFGQSQGQGQSYPPMGVMPGSPQVAQMMQVPMMMQPMAGQQMVPASPAYSVHSNMSGYSGDAGVPLDYLMAPQQYQQHQAQQQQYTMQPYQQPPSPMHGNMQMPLQGPPTQAQAPNGYPMMFAAQPSDGNDQTPVYMCVGMMPAGMTQRQMQ